jgi:cholesterol transport system auxiliary component
MMRYGPLSLRFLTFLSLALLGACASPPSPIYDLSAARPRKAAMLRGQWVVAEPVTLAIYDSERIIVRDSAGRLSQLPEAQWPERLPRLIQTRMIQTYQNASKLRQVGRPGERVSADYQLNLEIRRFEIDAASQRALVDIAARLLDDRTGRVLRAHVAQAQVPLDALIPASSAAGLDVALSEVMAEIADVL